MRCPLLSLLPDAKGRLRSIAQLEIPESTDEFSFSDRFIFEIIGKSRPYAVQNGVGS